MARTSYVLERIGEYSPSNSAQAHPCGLDPTVGSLDSGPTLYRRRGYPVPEALTALEIAPKKPKYLIFSFDIPHLANIILPVLYVVFAWWASRSGLLEAGQWVRSRAPDGEAVGERVYLDRHNEMRDEQWNVPSVRKTGIELLTRVRATVAEQSGDGGSVWYVKDVSRLTRESVTISSCTW